MSEDPREERARPFFCYWDKNFSFTGCYSIISEMVFVNLSTRPSGPGPTPYHTVILPTRPVLYFLR